MPQSDGLGRQITIQWGAALITGIFLLVAGLIGGRAWEVRIQGTPSSTHDRDLADKPTTTRDADVKELQRHIHDLETRSESDQANLLKQITSLRETLAARNAEILSYRTTDHGSRAGQAASPVKEVATGQRTPEPVNERPVDIRSTSQGDFVFAVQTCKRSGDVIRCSLTVRNTSSDRKEINLCSSYIVDDLGRQPGTGVDFGGTCGPSLEPNLPRRFGMSARVPGDARSLSIVLTDGSWGSFPGSAILRDVPISATIQ